jgi:hypothetical protein
MVEKVFFGMAFFACAAIGLSIVLAGLMMATADARTYEARRQADLEIVAAGQRVAGDVLLTSVGLVMVASGTSGILALMGVL